MWFVLGLVVFFLAYVWVSAESKFGDHDAGSESGDRNVAADEAFSELAKPMKTVWPGQLFASSMPMEFPDEHET